MVGHLHWPCVCCARACCALRASLAEGSSHSSWDYLRVGFLYRDQLSSPQGHEMISDSHKTANHALQRTRHDVVVCNRRVPWAGSLSLGRSRVRIMINWIPTTVFLTVLLMTGCAKREASRWDEVQFKVCLRSEPYKPGDTIASGEFEDLRVVSFPVQIKRGSGEADTIQDGIWLHVAWDDMRVEDKPRPCLVFEGFRSLVENRFRSPYGTSWWDNGWQDLGNIAILEEWNSFQTSVGIDSRGNDPRIWCKMWRWVKSPSKPDIELGEKRKREPDGAANGSQPIRSETNSTSSAAGSRR